MDKFNTETTINKDDVLTLVYGVIAGFISIAAISILVTMGGA